jgi:hypothetical protein
MNKTTVRLETAPLLILGNLAHIGRREEEKCNKLMSCSLMSGSLLRRGGGMVFMAGTMFASNG